MEIISRNFETNDWLTVVIILILGIMALAKIRFNYSFRRIFRLMFITGSYSKGELEDKDRRYNYFLFVAHGLIMALAFYFTGLKLDLLQDPTLNLFLKIALLYFGFVISKYLLEKIVGTILSLENLWNDYIDFKIAYKNLLSFFLFPFLVIITYYQDFSALCYEVFFWIYLMLNTLALLSFYRKRRLLDKSIWYYLILYLCTFELAPYLILYKLIV